VAESAAPYEKTILAFSGTRAIEDSGFPFEHFSEIAEMESWRKEINRPIYHIHKWWAQRLGSVFRAILLGAFAPKGSNILEMFYEPACLNNTVVFDPFMGSGTTIGEALKLGARVIGRDINPVAHFIVRTAFSTHVRRQIMDMFRDVEEDVAPTIRRFYQARLKGGGRATVLYYFWVKTVPCPRCEQRIDLFSTYVFSQHAYPARYPEARALCPKCGAINRVQYNANHCRCACCRNAYDPTAGPVRGARARCPACQYDLPIAKRIQETGRPPAHRLYAKMVLLPGGAKEYQPADDYDHALYEEASSLLKRRKDPYPVVAIEPGYNTDQALNYCYRYWHQMFNDRQLLCLSLLAQRIREIHDAGLRDLFVCLFSGALEFNNMFASFKGEGTGAVRHMFAHHILKPERTPLEANVWGTPKSSGSFSTLFESRILRYLDYCEDPFEIRVARENGRLASQKIFGLSRPVGCDVAGTFAELRAGKNLYLSCGDSSRTDLATESVDAVITDPPFFDNVHYSQLADFFYVWLRHILGENGNHSAVSTRSQAEVQQRDPNVFMERLCGVWKECHRVLRPNGLLIFTYHHSRNEGWRCVLHALMRAGFAIVAAHPIKAEMSVAAPKQQAKEPIDLDVILVCRKRESLSTSKENTLPLIEHAVREASARVSRFNRVGRPLSRNDVRVVVMAQVIMRLSWRSDDVESLLDSFETHIEKAILQLDSKQDVVKHFAEAKTRQLALW
jgi:adenine-specific DNA methylase